MFFIKVLLHKVLFFVSCTCLYLYSGLNLIATLLLSFQVYVVSYFVSLWTMKLLYLCAKVKPENKCVLITGCDSGFGYESALLLNKLGFKIFATCIQPNGDGAKQLIENAKYAKKMVIIGMDVTKDTDIESAYKTVTNYMSSSECLFGLVNNAGIIVTDELEYGPDLTKAKTIIDVNLLGMIKVTRQFLPLIRQAKGRIVNIESMASLIPIPNAIFYGVSKCGAAGFSENLRIGMYKFGISVVSINPWQYRTPLTNTANMLNEYENSFKSSSEEIQKAYGKKYVQKVLKALSTSRLATKSNAVPNAIVSALTVFEPDTRYIIAPIVMQPVLRAMIWMPRESLEVVYQILFWIFGLHRVYPDD